MANTATPDVDTVECPDDISDIPAHYVCTYRCNMEPGEDQVAICGYKVLGIPCPELKQATCEDCMRLRREHFLAHGFTPELLDALGIT